MLMSRGVKDDLRLMWTKHLAETLCIAYIGDDWGNQEVRVIFVQFEKNFKNAVLAVTEQNKFCWIAACDLAAKLTPDRTPSARNQNAFCSKRCSNGFIIHTHRFPAQKIVDIHFAQTIDADLP